MIFYASVFILTFQFYFFVHFKLKIHCINKTIIPHSVSVFIFIFNSMGNSIDMLVHFQVVVSCNQPNCIFPLL